MLAHGLVLQRVASAAAAPIDTHSVIATAISLAGVAAVSLPFGMYTKFLVVPKRRDVGAAAIAAGTVRAFFAPGILEEVI